MRKRLPALLVCALATGTAGCGGAGTAHVDVAQIRSVVSQFAEASDARACDLLSPDALVDLYGAFRKPVPVARAACVRRSAGFRGEPVTITDLSVIDSGSAHVTAVDRTGEVSYSVDLRRFGPAWRIDDVSQSKIDP